jgi:hypothetical protein
MFWLPKENLRLPNPPERNGRPGFGRCSWELDPAQLHRNRIRGARCYAGWIKAMKEKGVKLQVGEAHYRFTSTLFSFFSFFPLFAIATSYLDLVNSH